MLQGAHWYYMEFRGGGLHITPTDEKIASCRPGRFGSLINVPRTFKNAR